ncbi:NRAMP family divalent metal transporter [Cognatilysobacter lacus]|uniref:Divalent metal cation transporter n=1 Tax=Cognatilysobacter lacus TaxID=1643323 RepID=A0A5D8Z3K1_9GAMM|nr:divalent metal cation transporter [Lysobacter lacus]TZF89200.1 divalent metal cation transporter [Lysobacter lacus]
MSRPLLHRLTPFLRNVGPGVITGAADDDPSGIAAYSQAGAQFGYGLGWSMLLTYPLMVAVQLVSARIGRVTGAGLARNLATVFPKPVAALLVATVVFANTLNIGADLAAMGDAAALAFGGNAHLYVLGFTALSTGLQIQVPYRRYAHVLKWLTLSLFAYVGVLFAVDVDWRAALSGLFLPHAIDAAAMVTIVAVFGTTISPYLFFWQSSQEAEDISTVKGAHRLVDHPTGASHELRRIRDDTFGGMAFSNLVALAIMTATAATLHARGLTRIDTAAQAAQALRPIAGAFSSDLFALGIIGTGLLAVPVLAGSAAFAVGELRGWRTGLEYRFRQAPAFYLVIATSTVCGVALQWASVDPIKALVWSAVVNGVASVPLIFAIMLLGRNRRIMGAYTSGRVLTFFGWLSGAVMAAAAVAMLVSLAV